MHPPLFSAHLGKDAVYRLIHRQPQFVDAFPHRGFHGILAGGHHHFRYRAGHQSGAQTNIKSGTALHRFDLSFFGLGVVCAKERKKSGRKIAKW